MIDYIDKVLIPYRKATCRLRGYNPNQKALLIFDVFAAHRTEKFLNHLQSNNFVVIYVPASCTGELQPLDVSTNDPFKKAMKAEFTSWYGGLINAALVRGEALENIKVDLTLSTMRPIHARWLIKCVGSIKREEVVRGWDQSGILEKYKSITINTPTINKENPNQEDTQNINRHFLDAFQNA